MKASTFLKIFIALAAIGVVFYVVHNNNKATEITKLVSSPTSPYEFALHVDSVCDTIADTPNLAKAKKIYDRLYEEMDVYAGIKDSLGAFLIDQTTQDDLFAKAFETYYPKIESEATTLFNTDNWTPSQNALLKDEVNLLVDSKGNLTKRGIDKTQKKQLANYQTYFDKYDKFSKLLNRLEKCTDAKTYGDLSKLDNYTGYPYSNLVKFQQRRANAEDNAQESWSRDLKKKLDNIEKKGKDLLLCDSITLADVKAFNASVRQWDSIASIYEGIVPFANDEYKTSKNTLQSLYESIAKKEREQKKIVLIIQ